MSARANANAPTSSVWKIRKKHWMSLIILYSSLSDWVIRKHKRTTNIFMLLPRLELSCFVSWTGNCLLSLCVSSGCDDGSSADTAFYTMMIMRASQQVYNRKQIMKTTTAASSAANKQWPQSVATVAIRMRCLVAAGTGSGLLLRLESVFCWTQIQQIKSSEWAAILTRCYTLQYSLIKGMLVEIEWSAPYRQVKKVLLISNTKYKIW